MSEELKYIVARVEDILAGQQRLSDKLDEVRQEQVRQHTELLNLDNKLTKHDEILITGNGQLPITVKLASVDTRLKHTEGELKELRKVSNLPSTPDEIKKEKLKNIGKIIAFLTTLGTIIALILGGPSL